MNKLTGERVHYMNVGWTSEQEAQDEIDRLKKNSIKAPYPGDVLRSMDPRYLKTWMVATDYRIEPIKIFRHD